MEICEDETVALDRDACLYRNRMPEHRAAIREAVELATFSARVDRRGQFVEERRIELAPAATISRARLGVSAPNKGNRGLARVLNLVIG